MPTPLGHALAGIAAGWAVAGPMRSDRRAALTQAAILAALGAGADLDLLIGRHSGETHSLGAAAIVAAFAAWRRWPIASSRTMIGLAAFAAWATHPLLDSLAPDYSAPFGVMAFWPISSQYYLTGWTVFMAIWRAPGTLRAVTHDVVAIIRELAILLPITYGIWKVRKSESQ
jgi:membrane-bound metal-dependent hydrolase YbcI (DUF457 family)